MLVLVAYKPRKKRRKSLRKETVKVTVEGKKSRIHFTLEEEEVKAELVEYKHNPDLIKFGKIETKGRTLKVYAFKSNRKLLFIRINDRFIPLNKYKLRELMAFVVKAGWYVGLFGKRTKKYD